MTKRRKILTTSFLAAAFAVAVGFALQGHHQAAMYERQLANSYRHAFSELATAAGELDTALKKATYATTDPLRSVLYSQVYAKALTAQYALGELPYGNVELEQTAAFFAKVGDYAAALAHEREPVSEETTDTLAQLAQAATALSRSLYSLQSDLDAGSARLEDLAAVQQRLSAAWDGENAVESGSTFQTIEAEFPEVPSLIYDGPFSEHLTDKVPLALEGMAAVSQDEARARAAAFLSLPPEVLTLTSVSEGVLPTYSFSGSVDGGEVYVEVTRQGGQILHYFTDRVVTDAALSVDEAILVAHNYLTALGYPVMAETYYTEDGRTLTLNLAYTQDGVICYPDLVKVTVALDNGRLVGFEAHGYLSNHRVRADLTFGVDMETARDAVSPALTVLSYQPALIPTDGEYEVLCHEFKCANDDGEKVLVYINAATGLEEKILLLLEDESGTLVL